VAGFLTPAWLADLDAAARRASLPPDLRLTVQQVIPDGPDGQEFAYVVEAADGALSVQPGRAEHPDVTFTQDRATALAIQRGELSAQAAFIEGRLRLGGDLRAILDRAGSLADLDDVFAAARA
jgi:alkyl sulfatase BDS1-like metallo-beta-lactamase superfamily hydrolase